ncbi:MAG: hypothetical protein ACPHSD_19705, partial [Candidatus Latescibacterota bacterium]
APRRNRGEKEMTRSDQEKKALDFLTTQPFFNGLTEEQRSELVNILTTPEQYNRFKKFAYETLNQE